VYKKLVDDAPVLISMIAYLPVPVARLTQQDERSLGTTFRSSPPPFFKLRPSLSPIQLYASYIGFRTWRISAQPKRRHQGTHVDSTRTEAAVETIRYISKHTTIPVPKVRRAWCSDETAVILNASSMVRAHFCKARDEHGR
jgi:hypothetical protein